MKVSNEAKTLCFFLASFIVSHLWELLPDSEERFYDYIVFVRVGMCKQTYYFMLLTIVSNMILVSSFYFIAIKYRTIVHVLFFLYFLDLIDFKLFYGDTLFIYKDYPIHYSFIKGISMVSVFSFIIMREIYEAIRNRLDLCG